MTPPPNATVYETPLTVCWMGEDGIVYSKSSGAPRTIDNYKILFEVYAELSENGTKKFCIIGDITEAKPLEKDVREFVEQETAKYIKAMALLSYSTIGIAVGNVFQVMSTTPYPVVTFSDQKEALAWLRQKHKQISAV